ncbi:MAG: Mu transposase C-terminal domain-containing protein [Lysobacter sp.]
MSTAPSTFAVQPGTEVLVGQRRKTVTHVLDFNAVLARDAETGHVSQVAIAELEPIVSGATNASLELERVPEEDWQAAQRRLDIIRPLLGKRDRTRTEVSERANEFELHPNTLYGWLAMYEGSGRLTSLMPKTRRDKGSRKLSAEIEAIIRGSIEEVYLTSQRKPVSRVCDDVRRRCLNAGVEPPHANTIRNRIGQLSEPLRMERRRGRKAADEAFSPIEGAFPGADWPLAVVQIDHTKLDIILVDDRHRRPIGRPWITLAIDVFSRMVAGFYVSFDPPGALSTGLCLAHAILPKEQWLAKHDLDAEWPVWGFPKTLHMDNAKEFRGLMLQRACAEYGLDIDWRPVARPHFGGHIERLLGTASKEIHTLPGSTFSNPQQRGAYDSEGKAALTLGEFEAWLAVYVAKIYHQRKHSTIGMSPLAKYREGVFGTEQRPGVGLPARIADEDRLRLDFTPFEERTIQDYGVVIDGVHYYHDVLRRWIGAKDPTAAKQKRKFVFRRDPRDISTIWFFDPELRTYFPIPYRDTSHPAISLWELREAERLVKQAGKAPDERALFEAYDRMRAIEEAAQAKTTAVRRAHQRRRDGIGAEKPSATSKPFDGTGAIAPTKIEPFDELDPLTAGHD